MPFLALTSHHRGESPCIKAESNRSSVGRDCENWSSSIKH